jgi:hypothetical protein
VINKSESARGMTINKIKNFNFNKVLPAIILTNSITFIPLAQGVPCWLLKQSLKNRLRLYPMEEKKLFPYT